MNIFSIGIDPGKSGFIAINYGLNWEYFPITLINDTHVDLVSPINRTKLELKQSNCPFSSRADVAINRTKLELKLSPSAFILNLKVVLSIVPNWN